MSDWILPLKDLTLENLAEVGTKNAYLGEMLCHLSQQGVLVPDGFAITALAYRDFLVSSGLQSNLEQLLTKLDTEHDSNLQQIGMEARSCILHAQLPERLQQAIAGAYQQLRLQDPHLQVAVRSSLLVKELPDVSFAGQQESYLNIRSLPELIEACLNCYASLFSEQTIKYQAEKGFWQVGLSICVQKMVRSDQACAGVCFTIDPETGFDRVILISGNWGLGENVSQGSVNPDEFYVFKPLLHVAQQPIISRKLGSKTLTMVYADDDAEAEAAHLQGIKVGICGQAPSDDPSFARFLVEAGIDSVSFNPDALMLGLENIVAAEKVEPQRTRSTWLRGFPLT